MKNSFMDVNVVSLDGALSQLAAFKPVAYYDKHLDVIRVQIVDCSIWEERYDRIMTVYHANHALKAGGVGDIVGFAIKGVRHLLVDVGLPPDGAINIATLLDALVKKYPTRSTQFVIEFYRQLGNDAPEQVEVDLPVAA